ncbi:unnamed protein product [Thlaspi arvense]|uniref:Transposase MuDR plant domain-containing protein n=1 Tax=Thlaspi arvense TaxID=13288 RepID=A0AAU9T6H7_THLAR|nr:unnamed protein product [Thlaspi arvense]
MRFSANFAASISSVILVGIGPETAPTLVEKLGQDQSGKRVDIDDNESLGKVVSYAVGTCALTLFINEDGNEAEIQLQENANSDSDDGGRNTIDERKYKKFELGQCYSTIQSFKSVVTKYAVKKKYDISYFKTDSKRVVAVCCRRTCLWRICASINSTGSRVVVRSVQAEHNCTWQGKVYLCLLTHA